MIIHLTGGMRHVGDDLPYLRKIKEVINASGASVARDWVDTAVLSSSRLNDDEFDWEGVYEKSMIALQRSDLIIIEVTTYSFFQGFHLAKALDLGMPALLVFRENVPGLIFNGIPSPLISSHKYASEEELGEIVKAFIEQHSSYVKTKVEVDLSLKLDNFLKDQRDLSHKTDGELLRDLAEDGLKYRQIIKC